MVGVIYSGHRQEIDRRHVCLRSQGHLHYLRFWWELVKASMEASIAFMKASTTSTVASIASMAALMEAMEASMEEWKLP